MRAKQLRLEPIRANAQRSTPNVRDSNAFLPTRRSGFQPQSANWPKPSRKAESRLAAFICDSERSRGISSYSPWSTIFANSALISGQAYFFVLLSKFYFLLFRHYFVYRRRIIEQDPLNNRQRQAAILNQIVMKLAEPEIFARLVAITPEQIHDLPFADDEADFLVRA